MDPCLTHRLQMPESTRLTPIALGPTDGFANSFYSLTCAARQPLRAAPNARADGPSPSLFAGRARDRNNRVLERRPPQTATRPRALATD